MPDERDLVRSRVDLVELVSERVKLVRIGKKWKGLCPFHTEKTPSFQVDQELQLYHCFGCKKGGDLFDWVMQIDGVDFRTALENLAERAGVTLSRNKPAENTQSLTSVLEAALSFFQSALSDDSDARAYADSRGLNETTRAKWEIGFAPEHELALVTHLRKSGHKLDDAQAAGLAAGDPGSGYRDFFRNRIMFPIRDERGKLVGFSGRAIGDEQPKYINTRESPMFRKSETLYGLFQSRDALRESRHAILVEGQMDVIACHAAAVTSTLAPLGTALTEAGVRRIKRYADRVTLLFDGDVAGRRAAEKSYRLLRAGELACDIVLMSEGQDPDTVLRQDGVEAVRRLSESGVSLARFKLESLKREWRAAPGITDEPFWQSVKSILGEAEATECDTLILEVSPLHPNSRVDEKSTVQALRQDILRLRTPTKRAVVGKMANPTASSTMPRGPERTLLRAALSEVLASIALPRLQEEDLVVSQIGRELADAILQARAEAATQSTRDVIACLSEEMRNIAMSLETPPDNLATELPAVTHQSLEDAIARLEEERARRARSRAFAEQPTIENAAELYKST